MATGAQMFTLPAARPNPSHRHPQSVSPLRPHAQGVLSGEPPLSLGVTEWQEAGSRTGRTLLVRPCPLIRCFRQGGVRCGHSLPAHGRGVWQGHSSPALPPHPGGGGLRVPLMLVQRASTCMTLRTQARADSELGAFAASP